MARLQEAEKLYNDAVMRLGPAGRYGEAIRQVDKALEIRSEILGGDDFIARVCSPYLLLAPCSARFPQGRGGDGAPATTTRALGETHPMYAYGLKNLATIYGMMGDYAKAEPLLLQTAEIEKNAFGAEIPAAPTR